MREEVDKNNLQDLLEKQAVKKNDGMCNTYEYCRYCISRKKKKVTNNLGEEVREILNIYKEGNTPCADAYLKMEDNYGKNIKSR